MGFTDNFTKPPHHSPQKRLQSTPAQAMAMLDSLAKASDCSERHTVESRALNIIRAVSLTDLRLIPEPDIHDETSDKTKSHLINPTQNVVPTSNALPEAIDREDVVVEDSHVTDSLADKGIPVAPSTKLYNSPIQKVARNISWGNMDELFASPPKEHAIVANQKLSKRSPSKRSIIVNEDPTASVKSKDRSKKSSAASVAQSQRKEYYVSPMRLVADKLSLRSICLFGDKSSEADLQETLPASMHPGLSTNGKNNYAKGRGTGSSNKSDRSPKPYLKRAVSMQGGFKPRLHFDDDSTSESTTMDKSVHSFMSFSRPRSPHKFTSQSAAYARNRR